MTRLNILSSSSTQSPYQIHVSKKSQRRLEIQAKFERLWLLQKEALDPLQTNLGRERIQRSLDLLESHLSSLNGLKVVDLGCGSGAISAALAERGCQVDAVDIASNALSDLKKLHLKGIRCIHDCLPDTQLPDKTYDLAICTDVIADLDEKMHRLLLSEMARLVHQEGLCLFSSEVDPRFSDSITRLHQLFSSEFTSGASFVSHHRLLLSLQGLFSSKHALLQYLTKPCEKICKHSPRALHFFESLCQRLYKHRGITHVCFLGKRKKLDFSSFPNTMPKQSRL